MIQLEYKNVIKRYEIINRKKIKQEAGCCPGLY